MLASCLDWETQYKLIYYKLDGKGQRGCLREYWRFNPLGRRTKKQEKSRGLNLRKGNPFVLLQAAIVDT